MIPVYGEVGAVYSLWAWGCGVLDGRDPKPGEA